MVLDDDLDEIIESEYKRAIEILDELGMIEYLESKYGINYKVPELEIVEDGPFIAKYSNSKKKIIFSKGSIEREIDNQLKFLGYEGIKRSISDIQGIEHLKYWKYNYHSNIEKYSKLFENEISFSKKPIETTDNLLEYSNYKGKRNICYLNKSYNSILLYPFYINKKNIIEAIAESIIRSIKFHEFWHSFDRSILNKLDKDFTIKDRDYLLIILNDHDNRELRASAFEVIMYYLVTGLYKDEKGLVAAYSNIPTCREYIEEMNKLEKDEHKRIRVPYDLGFCYGNIIVVKYKSSLKENIYKIIDDIINLDKERAIDVIKHYGDNFEKLLHD